MVDQPWLGRAFGVVIIGILLIITGCQAAGPGSAPSGALPTAVMGDGGEEAATETVEAAGDEAAIQRAVRDYLTAQGSTLAEAVTVTVEEMEGDFARVRVTPDDPMATDPATAYVQRMDGEWTVLVMGTAFGPELETEYGIPEALRDGGAGDMTDSPTAGTVGPLSDQACDTLRAVVEETLELPAQVEAEAPFNDPVGNRSGTGCQVLVTGTGVDFPSFLDVAGRLRAALMEAGWTEDPAYLADGPTGTATAFRQDDQLLLLSVDWSPAAEVSCPADRPISECQVPPEQQRYTITLNAAQQQASDG